MKWKLYILVILCGLSATLHAQKDIRNDVVNALLFGVNYQFQLPFANMSHRFGYSHTVGATADYKLKNWTIGFSGNFLFGNQVKGDVIAGLRDENGLVVNIDGVPTDVFLYERGWRVGFDAGRIVPIAKRPNKNSGLYFKLSAGYMQHKIVINSNAKQVPQLNKEYRKGYDRLSGGFSTTQFIGYMFLDNKKFINFYIGIEFQEAFTKGYRAWQFDINAPALGNRIDGLFGIKAGWLIPAYRKEKAEKFYYN